MKNTKKAQGISLNVVVVAAIALLVLVILTVIVINNTGKVQEGLACEAQPNSQCVSGDSCPDAYPIYAQQYACSANQRCCINTASAGNGNEVPSSGIN